MKSHPDIASDDEHRVLKFRPRTSDTLLGDPQPIIAADEPDDFQHRMWTNVAALAFTVALVGAGIWLAVSIADLRKTQDCVLMGRRDCARLSSLTVEASFTEPVAHHH